VLKINKENGNNFSKMGKLLDMFVLICLPSNLAPVTKNMGGKVNREHGAPTQALAVT
jgi:hypothetical protein